LLKMLKGREAYARDLLKEVYGRRKALSREMANVQSRRRGGGEVEGRKPTRSLKRLVGA